MKIVHARKSESGMQKQDGNHGKEGRLLEHTDGNCVTKLSD